VKLVIGIVRPEQANEVLEALYRAEVRGFSISRVQGHGGELDRVETYRGTTVKMGLAEKVRLEVRRDLEQQQRYYAYLKAERPEFYGGSVEGQEQILNDVAMVALDNIEKKYAPQTQPPQPVETNKSIVNPIKGNDSNGAKKPDSQKIK